MKYSTVKRQRTAGAKEPVSFRPGKPAKQNPTDLKYRNASGERKPIVGGSLAELERKLTAIEQTKNETQNLKSDPARS